jgi:hypothetical protein
MNNGGRPKDVMHDNEILNSDIFSLYIITSRINESQTLIHGYEENNRSV